MPKLDPLVKSATQEIFNPQARGLGFKGLAAEDWGNVEQWR